MNEPFRCYIHIGAPKTGTTLLQKILFLNREALAQRGILYPDASIRGFGHHDLAYLLAGGYPDYATPQPQTLDEITATLAAEIERHHGSIVMSSENFYLFPQPQALYELLQRAGCLYERDATIIVYVRRQDDAHESWYNQTVKAQGLTHDVETCIDQSYDLWDYQKQLTAWAAVFGDRALIVRPYEEEQFEGGSLVTDFFSIFGVPVDILHGREQRVNSSLNKDILEFQRIVNKLPMSVQEKRRFHRQLIELSEQTAGSGLFSEEPSIDGNRRRSIRDYYACGNTLLARTYLGREMLFVDECFRELRTVSAVTPILTTEKVSLILGWLLNRDG